MKTIIELFSRLEARGIAYAVLRNYEKLPDLRVSERASNTDIDLVVASNELPEFRKVLVSLAADLGWDALSECDHFTRSESRHHNIEIFRFYRVSPLEFLQIDVFHGFVSWGLPLMDEADLLADRIYDAQRGLTRINLLKENTYRLVQLNGLGDFQRLTDKTNRYRAKVLDVYSTRRREYCAQVRRYLGLTGLAAVRALQKSKGQRFSAMMWCAKAWFTIRFTLSHPGQTVGFVCQRILDHRARFRTRQCGALVKANTATPETRAILISLMDSLTGLNAFDGWVERSGPADSFTGRERRVMEQGGMVIQWTSREDADVVFSHSESRESMAAKIIGCALDRHVLLQSCLQSERMLEAVER